MTQQIKPQEEAIALMTLSLIDGVGYWGLRKLKEKNKSLRSLLKDCQSYGEIDKALQEAGIKRTFPQTTSWSKDIVALWSQGLGQLRELHKQGIHLLVSSDPRFPPQLLELDDPPHWLFVEGKVDCLTKPSIAVVGTRKPTHEGEFVCEYVTRVACLYDCAIVSGLARGIDQLAHYTSLAAGIPNIAVMGTGILETYPKGASDLRKLIVNSGGVVVSEYLPKQRYSRENFVRRNRIQAGLSRVVIPAEWSAKSGTAHTVNFANAYSKKLVLPRLSAYSTDSSWLDETAEKLGGFVMSIPGSESEILEIFDTEFERLHVEELRACAYLRPEQDLFENGGGDSVSSDKEAETHLTLAGDKKESIFVKLRRKLFGAK